MDPRARLVEENRLFATAATAGAPGVRVPHCPDWTLAQLVTHVGRGDRWAAAIVSGGGPVDPREVPDGRAPEGPDAARDWLAGGARALLDAVAADPDAPVWTFVGPRPARWWVRRRLHEALVHRADAVQATGSTFAPDPSTAADGVAEWLTLVADRATAGRDAAVPLGRGVSLHLHATDEGLGEGGEWTVRHDDAGLSWEHGHAKGSVAVRGSAADLLLLLLRRASADDDRFVVFGEACVLQTWLDRTPF